jgi:hypothetical protein
MLEPVTLANLRRLIAVQKGGTPEATLQSYLISRILS